MPERPSAPGGPGPVTRPETGQRERRIKRAIQTAREAATCDPGLAEIKLRRFHRAMDELEDRSEGEAVYDALRSERWYDLAARALARAR